MLQLVLVVLLARASGCVAELLPARTVSWRRIERDAATILTSAESTRLSLATQKWQALQMDLRSSLVLQSSPRKGDFDLKKYDEITKTDFVTACKVTFNIPKFAVPVKVVRKNCLEVGGKTSDCRAMVENLWVAHKKKKFEPWCKSVFDFFARKTEPKCPDKCTTLFCKPRCDIGTKVKDVDVMQEALEYKMNQTATRRKNLAGNEKERKRVVEAFNKSKVVPALGVLVKARKGEAEADAKLSKAAKKLLAARKADAESTHAKRSAIAKQKALDDLTATAHKAVQESAAAEREEKALKGQLNKVKEIVKQAELVKVNRTKALDGMKSALASAKKAITDSEEAFGKVDKSDLKDLDGLITKKVKSETAAFQKLSKAESAAAAQKRAADTLSRRLDDVKQQHAACKSKTAGLRTGAKESEKGVNADEKSRRKVLAKYDGGDVSKSIKESKKGIAAQAKKVKELKDLLSELSGKISNAKSRVSNAEHKIDIMKRALKAQSPSKEKRIAAETRIKEATKSLEAVKKSLATLVKRQEMVSKLEGKSNKAYDKMTKELQGLEAAKMEVDKLDGKLKVGKAKLNKDKQKADDSEKTCGNVGLSLKKLEKSVEAAKKDSNKSKKDVEDAKKEFATAQAETTKFRKAASSLKFNRKAELSVSANLKKFTESKFDTIVAEVKRLTAKQRELEGSLKASSADLAKAKAKKAKAETTAKQAKEKLDKELAKAQKEVQKTRAALKESSTEHTKCTDADRKAKAARVAAEQKYDVVAKRVKEMEADFNESDERRKAELAKLKKREKAMEGELGKLKEKKKDLEGSIKPIWKGLL
mmetsp:Transcript_31120/g.61120  ORF Transcript_31120/g.61120 Transcript_31120/m.61120 type:complete len:820 (+) Transcript_31120:30-2489(+)